MERLEVGQVKESWINHNEGTYFNFDNLGVSLITFFHSPTQYEIAQFHSTARFEMRVITLKDIIIFTIKIGSLNWMDAPYSPHLNTTEPILEEISEGSGYALTLILVDAKTGKIEHLRLISISNDFSKKIKKEIESNLTKTFDQSSYAQNLQFIFKNYTTKQLASMSNTYFKIN